MGRILKFIAPIAFMLISQTLYAQKQAEMADGMRAEGKIYVVVAIILIVLGGLAAYLFLLDKKVKKLENLLSGKNPPTK